MNNILISEQSPINYSHSIKNALFYVFWGIEGLRINVVGGRNPPPSPLKKNVGDEEDVWYDVYVQV